MGRSVEQLAAAVIGEAQGDPRKAPEILAREAERFLHLARDPKNARHAAALRAMAGEFKSAVGSFLPAKYGPPPAEPVLVNDFEEQQEEMAEAYETEAGTSDDQTVHARQELIHQAKDDGAIVSIAPRSIRDGMLIGNSATVKFKPTQAEIDSNILPSQTLFEWQGKKRETQSWTIDLDVTDFFADSGGSNRPFGKLQYGADAYISPQIEVDVGFGQRLTGKGNYVSLLVSMDPPGFGKPAGQMTIGGTFGLFAATSTAPVTRTRYVDLLPAFNAALPDLNKALIFRPLRAQALLPPQMTDLMGSVQLDFLDVNGVFLYSLQFGNGQVVAPIPLSNEVYQIKVSNLGTVACTYRFVFQLAL